MSSWAWESRCGWARWFCGGLPGEVGLPLEQLSCQARVGMGTMEPGNSTVVCSRRQATAKPVFRLGIGVHRSGEAGWLCGHFLRKVGLPLCKLFSHVWVYMSSVGLLLFNSFPAVPICQFSGRVGCCMVFDTLLSFVSSCLSSIQLGSLCYMHLHEFDGITAGSQGRGESVATGPQIRAHPSSGFHFKMVLCHSSLGCEDGDAQGGLLLWCNAATCTPSYSLSWIHNLLGLGDSPVARISGICGSNESHWGSPVDLFFVRRLSDSRLILVERQFVRGRIPCSPSIVLFWDFVLCRNFAIHLALFSIFPQSLQSNIVGYLADITPLSLSLKKKK